MTRLICTVFAALTLCISALAQNAATAITTDCFTSVKPTPENAKGFGSLKVLKGQKRVNISFYYYDATFRKNPLVEGSDDFYPENILKSTSEINERVLASLNDKLEKVKEAPFFSNVTPEKYCLKAHVLNVDKKGNTELHLILIDTETCNVEYEKYYDVEGGTWGTQVNLLGDAAGELGKVLAKEMAKVCK